MSATTLAFESPRSEMSALRVLRIYLLEGKYEALRMLRSLPFSVPLLVFPIAFYLFFATVVVAGPVAKNPDAALFMFAGFSTLAVAGPPLFGFGILLAIERGSGLYAFRRAMPMPPGALLLAKTLMSVVFSVIVIAILLPLALTVGHVDLSWWRVAAIAGVLVAGVVPFCAIGLYIGARAGASAAPAIVNLVYHPMMYLSGIFFPLPQALANFQPIWPTFHVRQLVFAAGGLPIQGGDVIEHIVALLSMTLLFLALALRRLMRNG